MYGQAGLEVTWGPYTSYQGLILLSSGEMDFEENDMFIRCVHKSQQLCMMMTLKASAGVADVSLKRKPRYDIANLRF